MEGSCAKQQSFAVPRIKQAFILAMGAAAVIIFPAFCRSEDAITPAEARKAWKDGHLEYIRVPLKIVIASVNVHSRKPIVLADDTVGNLLFSGTVFEDEIPDWLRALTMTYPVVVIEGDDRIVISMCKSLDDEGAPLK